MLKRIQKIKNVGTFVNAKAASIELGNLVYLYGSNSQGKTTFCDIFKSIIMKNPSYIVQRKTIGIKEDQKISLNFGEHKELNFENGIWTMKGEIPELENIQIFDTDFVYKNVFTNEHFEHQNKENFTRFVIGDESVKLSLDLEELNRQKRELEKEINQLEQNLSNQLSEKIDLEEFVNMDYHDDITKEDIQCLEIKSAINQEINNTKEINEIKRIKIPKVNSSLDVNFIENYKKIDDIFGSSIDFDKKTLIDNFNKHKISCIKKEFSNDFDKWVVQGMDLQKDNLHCPYCGSELNENLVVESYFELFSKEIKEYNNNIEWIKNFSFCSKIQIPNEIYSVLNVIEKNNSKIFNKSIQNTFNKLEGLKDELIECVEKANKLLNCLNTEIQSKKEAKERTPYKSISQFSLKNLTEIIERIECLYKSLKDAINEYGEMANKYICDLSIETIDKHLSILENEYVKYYSVCLRNKLNAEIKSLFDKRNSLQIIINNIKLKKTDFDNSQETYLDEFFKDINYYFELFGSRDYTIDKKTTTQGINRTYSLGLKFKGATVPSDKIRFVLSESDRRALALAIFFSKLKKSANKSMIVILDDPITSFDTDRMNVFINIIKELKNKVCQIIITTHYQTFYKKLVNLTNCDNTVTLMKIKPDQSGNNFVKVEKNKELLLMDDYESKLFEMTSFMKGETHEYSEVSARIILQKCLEYHFSYELLGVRYNNLRELIEYLKGNGFLTDELYIRLNNKREEYNAAAHQFECDSEEQKRNSICQLYKLLQKI